MARKSGSADLAKTPAADRVTLPRRGATPLRLEACLVDEVTLAPRGAEGEMRLRLWQGKGRIAVEVVITGPLGPVLDAASAPTVEGIADWLEALDPWDASAPPTADGTGIATALWAEALRAEGRSDFRWLVGEALYRWQGLNAGAIAGLETAS